MLGAMLVEIDGGWKQVDDFDFDAQARWFDTNASRNFNIRSTWRTRVQYMSCTKHTHTQSTVTMTVREWKRRLEAGGNVPSVALATRGEL